MTVQRAILASKKHKRVFAQHSRFEPGRHGRVLSTVIGVIFARLMPLAVFLFAHCISPVAIAQNTEPSENSRSQLLSSAPSPFPLDSTRISANSQASPSPATIVSTISAPSDYQLSTDDQIAVEVFGEDDLRTAARLNADGAVSLPLLGSVQLAGLTLNQTARKLTELYGRDYLVNPKVNVMLIAYAKRRFTVLGQVNRPGSYDMPEGSPSGIDLLEAIAIAGGYTRIAAPERISVKRRNQIMRVDAKRLARRGGKEGNFLVEPGDTITVAESLF
jgi:protein involved in polysaccharide export with SLBB domain